MRSQAGAWEREDYIRQIKTTFETTDCTDDTDKKTNHLCNLQNLWLSFDIIRFEAENCLRNI